PAGRDEAWSRGGQAAAQVSSATGFRSVPTPSTQTSTTSRSRGYGGGVRESPTPPGVPVAITSPGSSVIPAEAYWISSTIEKIRLRVFELWSSSPEPVVLMWIAARSTPSAAATEGPIGANVSKLLPSVNW